MDCFDVCKNGWSERRFPGATPSAPRRLPKTAAATSGIVSLVVGRPLHDGALCSLFSTSGVVRARVRLVSSRLVVAMAHHHGRLEDRMYAHARLDWQKREKTSWFARLMATSSSSP